MSYPIITHIDELKEKVEHLSEIRFAEQPNGTTVVCYMIADTNTFTGPYEDWSKECRGITFDKNEKILVRTMEKFFNVNECPDTQEHLLDWTKVIRKMEKRDGSMITPALVDGKLVFKSKKSFESDVVKITDNAATLNDKVFCQAMCESGFTPTFELTTPDQRIVIKYQESKLTLLHVRENTTGRYLSANDLQQLAMLYDIDLVRDYDITNFSWEEDKKFLQVVTDFEGFVYQFSDDTMVKAKSKWYLERHHLLTGLTYRNVAEAVVSETIDDMKSFIYEVNEPELIKKVLEIESEIVKQITTMRDFVETIYEAEKHLARKEFAIKFSTIPAFGLLMTKFLGKEPDYLGFYAKNFLKQDWEVKSL